MSFLAHSCRDPPQKYKIDPDTWYVGLWTGIDPQDGTSMNREFVPVMGQENNFTFTGRIEYSQICASPPPTDGDVQEPSIATDSKIPAQLNGFGQVDHDTNVMKVLEALTCLGALEPLARDVPVEYVPVSQDIMMEIPAFRADSPIYMHRMSAYYKPLDW